MLMFNSDADANADASFCCLRLAKILNTGAGLCNGEQEPWSQETARCRAEKREAMDTDTRRARVLKGLRCRQGRIGRSSPAVHVAVEEIDVQRPAAALRVRNALGDGPGVCAWQGRYLCTLRRYSTAYCGPCLLLSSRSDREAGAEGGERPCRQKERAGAPVGSVKMAPLGLPCLADSLAVSGSMSSILTGPSTGLMKR